MSSFSVFGAQVSSLSKFSEENIIQHYENYDEKSQENVLKFLCHDLEVPCEEKENLNEQSSARNQYMIVPKQKLAETVDFIQLAFKSKIRNKYQNLVVKIAYSIPNKFFNNGVKYFYTMHNDRPQDLNTAIQDISEFENTNDLTSYAIALHQNQLAKKLMIPNTNEINLLLFYTASRSNNVEIAEHLLKNGVFVSNQYGDEKITALHVAATFHRAEMINFLLNNNADCNLKICPTIHNKKYEFTPLELAIGSSDDTTLHEYLQGNKSLYKASVETNFEKNKTICTILAQKNSLVTLIHSYIKTYKFLPETSPLKLFLKQQIAIKLKNKQKRI